MEKFKQLVKEGKMDKQTFDTWFHGTIVDNLPKRVGAHSPKNAEHVHTERRTARKRRTQRKHRTMPTQRKSRSKPTQRKQRKKRTMPI